MVWVAFFLSFLACGLSVFFYWKLRRNQELSVEQFSNRVSGLLSEFNSVTNSKVELLDERTEDLRRLVDLANLKIKKMNKLLDNLDHHEAELDQLSDPEPSTDTGDPELPEHEQVLEMAKNGKSSSEIASCTDFTPGEISVILKVNNSTTQETGVHQ